MSKSLAETLNAAAGSPIASKEIITHIEPERLLLVTDRRSTQYDPGRADTDPLSEAFVLDIKARGVLKPILVRRNGTDAMGFPILQVIAGRRRVRHALEVNKRWPEASVRVPVRTVFGNDKEMLLLALAENAHSESESPISKAWKIRSLMQLGGSMEEVCVACDKTPQTVNRYLAFLNLEESVQLAITDGRLPMGSVDAFEDVPREDQPAVLVKLLESGASKTHEVRAAVKAHKDGVVYTPPSKRMWDRGHIEVLRETFRDLSETETKNREVKMAAALLGVLLGDDDAATEYPWIATAMKHVAPKRRTRKGKK